MNEILDKIKMAYDTKIIKRHIKKKKLKPKDINPYSVDDLKMIYNARH